jgi:hypothetical protein
MGPNILIILIVVIVAIVVVSILIFTNKSGDNIIPVESKVEVPINRVVVPINNRVVPVENRVSIERNIPAENRIIPAENRIIIPERNTPIILTESERQQLTVTSERALTNHNRLIDELKTVPESERKSITEQLIQSENKIAEEILTLQTDKITKNTNVLQDKLNASIQRAKRLEYIAELAAIDAKQTLTLYAVIHINALRDYTNAQNIFIKNKNDNVLKNQIQVTLDDLNLIKSSYEKANKAYIEANALVQSRRNDLKKTYGIYMDAWVQTESQIITDLMNAKIAQEQDTKAISALQVQLNIIKQQNDDIIKLAATRRQELITLGNDITDLVTKGVKSNPNNITITNIDLIYTKDADLTLQKMSDDDILSFKDISNNIIIPSLFNITDPDPKKFDDNSLTDDNMKSFNTLLASTYNYLIANGALVNGLDNNDIYNTQKQKYVTLKNDILSAIKLKIKNVYMNGYTIATNTAVNNISIALANLNTAINNYKAVNNYLWYPVNATIYDAAVNLSGDVLYKTKTTYISPMPDIESLYNTIDNKRFTYTSEYYKDLQKIFNYTHILNIHASKEQKILDKINLLSCKDLAEKFGIWKAVFGLDNHRDPHDSRVIFRWYFGAEPIRESRGSWTSNPDVDLTDISNYIKDTKTSFNRKQKALYIWDKFISSSNKNTSTTACLKVDGIKNYNRPEYVEERCLCSDSSTFKNAKECTSNSFLGIHHICRNNMQQWTNVIDQDGAMILPNPHNIGNINDISKRLRDGSIYVLRKENTNDYNLELTNFDQLME